MAGGRAPVASEGGAVAAMAVSECVGKPSDVGGVVCFFLSGHDSLKVKFGFAGLLRGYFFGGLVRLGIKGAHEGLDSCGVGLDLPGRSSGADGLIGIERGLVDSFRPKVICSRTADGGFATGGFGVACEGYESAVGLVENVPVVFFCLTLSGNLLRPFLFFYFGFRFWSFGFSLPEYPNSQP